MAGTDYLYAIAQVAVALVGFSGVVASLQVRANGSYSSEDAQLLRLLIERGMAALAFALLPALLGLLEISVHALWFSCSTLMAAYTLVSFLRLLRRRPFGTAAQTPLGRWGFYVATCVALTTAFLLQLLNALAVLPNSGVGWYALGATWFLVAGGMLFVQLVGRHVRAA